MTGPEDSFVLWHDEPGQNIDHIAAHGLTVAEVESVLLNPVLPIESSESSGRPCRFGWTDTGRFIIAVWDEYEDTDPPTCYPVTACEVPLP
ncbi:MAG: hypothetical protein ACRC7O_14290 [Fimbriiglobus sp.]